MKHIITTLCLASLLAVGCSKTPPAKVAPPPVPEDPPTANMEQCDHLYQHLLTFVVDHELNTPHALTPEQKKYAAHLLDEKLQEGGQKAHFYATCLTLSIVQYNCVLGAKSLEEMNACRLVK